MFRPLRAESLSAARRRSENGIPSADLERQQQTPKRVQSQPPRDNDALCTSGRESSWLSRSSAPAARSVQLWFQTPKRLSFRTPETKCGSNGFSRSTSVGSRMLNHASQIGMLSVSPPGTVPKSCPEAPSGDQSRRSCSQGASPSRTAVHGCTHMSECHSPSRCRPRPPPAAPEPPQPFLQFMEPDVLPQPSLVPCLSLQAPGLRSSILGVSNSPANAEPSSNLKPVFPVRDSVSHASRQLPQASGSIRTEPQSMDKKPLPRDDESGLGHVKLDATTPCKSPELINDIWNPLPGAWRCLPTPPRITVAANVCPHPCMTMTHSAYPVSGAETGTKALSEALASRDTSITGNWAPAPPSQNALFEVFVKPIQLLEHMAPTTAKPCRLSVESEGGKQCETTTNSTARSEYFFCGDKHQQHESSYVASEPFNEHVADPSANLLANYARQGTNNMCSQEPRLQHEVYSSSPPHCMNLPQQLSSLHSAFSQQHCPSKHEEHSFPGHSPGHPLPPCEQPGHYQCDDVQLVNQDPHQQQQERDLRRLPQQPQQLQRQQQQEFRDEQEPQNHQDQRFQHRDLQREELNHQHFNGSESRDVHQQNEVRDWHDLVQQHGKSQRNSRQLPTLLASRCSREVTRERLHKSLPDCSRLSIESTACPSDHNFMQAGQRLEHPRFSNESALCFSAPSVGQASQRSSFAVSEMAPQQHSSYDHPDRHVSLLVPARAAASLDEGRASIGSFDNGANSCGHHNRRASLPPPPPPVMPTNGNGGSCLPGPSSIEQVADLWERRCPAETTLRAKIKKMTEPEDERAGMTLAQQEVHATQALRTKLSNMQMDLESITEDYKKWETTLQAQTARAARELQQVETIKAHQQAALAALGNAGQSEDL